MLKDKGKWWLKKAEKLVPAICFTVLDPLAEGTKVFGWQFTEYSDKGRLDIYENGDMEWNPRTP